jgi:hypothetical protein
MIPALLVTLFGIVDSGFACVNGYPSVAAEWRMRRVFTGTVLSMRDEPETDHFDVDGQTYTVRVDEALRGRIGKTVRIFSENSSGRFPMDVGRKYLLFVYRARDRLIVDNCGNSGIYRESSSTMRAVRKLQAAEQRARRAPDDSVGPCCTVASSRRNDRSEVVR